jgi:hypothetical protein
MSDDAPETPRPPPDPAAEKAKDDLAYWRAREGEERDRAAEASCMARTAHEDLADDYAELIERQRPDAE